jgi:hypothetical protein
LVLLSFLGYVILAFSFPLLANYDMQPVGDIRTFAPATAQGLLFGLLILLLFTLHWLLFKRFLDSTSVSLGQILIAGCLLALPLLFMYPVNANDVYRYVIRGLISSRYGLSPFEKAPADFGDDLYPLLAGEWFDATSPYGPLWESLSWIVTSAGGENLLANIILFKIAGYGALLAAGIVIWKVLALNPGSGTKGKGRLPAFTALWVLNPALLLTFVGNAHNDALMILFLLTGWLVIRSGFQGPGLLVMLAAALVKPIALLALPIALVLSWKECEDGRNRLLCLLWLFVGGAALVYLAFLPFGNPTSLMVRLLNEASAGASFSPLTLLILAARELDLNISFALLARLAAMAFAVFFLWVLWRTWRRQTAEQGIALVFWGYILQALNFRIWYAAWPFPWLLVDGFNGEWRATRRLTAGLWFLMTSQLSVVLYGHIRVAFLGGSQFLAHLIGVPFVYLLPIILAWMTVPYREPCPSEEV